MNAETNRWTKILLADKKAWQKRAKGKFERPLKDRSTGELRADGIHEAIRVERKLRTCGEALKLVGTELRIRACEGDGK